MKNHFNNAAYGYKSCKNDYLETWKYGATNSSKQSIYTWSSSCAVTDHKGFGDTSYQIIRDPDFAIYIAEAAAKAMAEKKAKAAALAQSTQAIEQLAIEAVNKACAEALAEHAAPRTPTLFSRLFGRAP